MGARLRGHTATQRSKIWVLRRFWEGFWGKVLRRGSAKGGLFSMGFTVQKGSEQGSQKGF